MQWGWLVRSGALSLLGDLKEEGCLKLVSFSDCGGFSCFPAQTAACRLGSGSSGALESSSALARGLGCSGTWTLPGPGLRCCPLRRQWIPIHCAAAEVLQQRAAVVERVWNISSTVGAWRELGPDESCRIFNLVMPKSKTPN